MLLIFSLLIITLFFIGFLYLNFNPQFGGKFTKQEQLVLQKSKQWEGDKFVNETTTTVGVNLKTLPGLLKEQFSNGKSRKPEAALPIVPLDSAGFNGNHDKPKFIWYGHSVLLLQIAGKNLLIDPMLGGNASPIAPFATKRFSDSTLDIIDTLPPLDAVLMTHDHYDHLDYDSIKKIKDKVSTYFVAMGVSRHLQRWSIPKDQITEFDWWDGVSFQGIDITFTPSRHFSGRGLFDRTKSLWGGWVFCTPDYRIYWSGDGGYGDHFKTIGEKLGPFDWAFMECGQYHELWHQIHMYPEESVRAAVESQAKVAIPVHWAGFSLSLHSWKEPAERFVTAAEKEGLPVCTPKLGEVVALGDKVNNGQWWEAYN